MGVIPYNHDEEIKKIKRRIECLERTIVDCETHEMYDMGTILRDKKVELEKDLDDLEKLR